MIVDYESASKLATAYTAGWNSGSREAVAEFYAHDGQIVINGARHGSVGKPSLIWPPDSSQTYPISNSFATMYDALAPMSCTSGHSPELTPPPNTLYELLDGRSGILTAH